MTVAMLSQNLIMKVGNAASPEVFTSIGEVVSFGSFVPFGLVDRAGRSDSLMR